MCITANVKKEAEHSEVFSSDRKTTNLFCNSTKWNLQLPKTLQFHKHHQLILLHDSAKNWIHVFDPKYGLQDHDEAIIFSFLFEIFIG